MADILKEECRRGVNPESALRGKVLLAGSHQKIPSGARMGASLGSPVWSQECEPDLKTREPLAFVAVDIPGS